MWHCVDAAGNESWPWKRHAACTVLGLGTGLLFTPMMGVLVGVTCRVFIPTPAYNVLPVTPLVGYGVWTDDEFMEQGDFEFHEYRYDPSTNEYWIEVTSYDYPLSDSYDFRYGDGGQCPLGQRRCDYPG